MAQKSKGSAKIGRGKRPGEAARRTRYREVRWADHKMKRILLGNGLPAAQAWARAAQRDSALLRLVRSSRSTHVRRAGAALL